MKAALFFLLLAAPAFGEPIELSRQQASELCAALMAVEPGLNAENVMLAADDIAALKPIAISLEKGKLAADRDMACLPASDDRIAKQWQIRAAIDRKGDELVRVELSRFDVTADEIKAAKIPPRVLSPIREFIRKK
jgi:hypothetical protein